MSIVESKPVRSTQYRGDADLRRVTPYQRRSEALYRDLVARVADPNRPETGWQRYLRDAQARPGWSVARIARESKGRISKATIFRMIAGDTKNVSAQRVRIIAEVLGDDPEVALRAAGDVLQEIERREWDENDPAVRIFRASGLPDHVQDFLIRNEMAERERRASQAVELARAGAVQTDSNSSDTE